MKKVKFIYNPSSGETQIAERLDEIVTFYQKRGYAVSFHRLDFKCAPEEVLFDLDLSYDHMVIAGGDGTVNYVINLFKQKDIDIPVAIIPAGTANDFAGMLGLQTSDIIKACGKVLDGEIITVDLGMVNGRYFVNVFSCGLFTEVSHKTPTILKNTFGKLAYYVGGIGELTRFRKINIKIESDGGNFEGNCVIFFVFNGKTAGNLRIAYLSEVNDGLLDVLIIKGDNPIRSIQTVLQYLSRISTHADTYPPGVVHLRCSTLHAECRRDEVTDIDGQPGPDFPLDIVCDKAALRVMVPKVFMSRRRLKPFFPFEI